MHKMIFALLAAVGLLAPVVAPAQALWVEGQHYEVIEPAVPTSTPGKVEVVEVFSYGCPYCFQALPVAEELKRNLPAFARMVYVPASFIPSEAWPMFQRAYVTAQAMGIADKTHQGIFDAIWKTGELRTIDPATQRIVKPLPTIEDAAKVYARLAGVKEADFLKVAQSADVDARMRKADDLVKAYKIPGTPAFVVNGHYRIGQVGSVQDLIRLVNYLAAKEPQARQ